MLYSEKELEKRLKAGCALYYFYASDEALVHTAAKNELGFAPRPYKETLHDLAVWLKQEGKIA